MPRRDWATLRARRGPREPATRGVLSGRLSVAGDRERSLATQIGPVPALTVTGRLDTVLARFDPRVVAHDHRGEPRATGVRRASRARGGPGLRSAEPRAGFPRRPVPDLPRAPAPRSRPPVPRRLLLPDAL